MRTSHASKVRRAWKSWAIEIGVVLAVMVAMHFWQTRNAASGKAPNIDAMRLDGTRALLSGPREKPLLVHFWATWCGVCTAEAGNVTALTESHDVLTIATQSGSDAEVRRNMASRGLTWPVVNDPSGSIAARWGAHAFPTSFVVAPDGSIRHVEVGYTTTLGLKARMWLAGL